jgi:hypothetical protein
MLSAETSSLVLLVCALTAAAMAAAHALAALRDAWVARAGRRNPTTSRALRPGLALIRGVVARDDDSSPAATVAVTQVLSPSAATRSRWRECAPRTRHARAFSLALDDGTLVRVETAAGVTLHAPLAPVTAPAPSAVSDGATRTLVAQISAGQPVTVLGALVRHDALAPPPGASGDYRASALGAAWTVRGFAGRPPLVSAEAPDVARGLAQRNGRLALAWCGVLLVSQGALLAEKAWVSSRYERVTARSEGCQSRIRSIRSSRGGSSYRSYQVTDFRLPTGEMVRDEGCWEAGRDRRVWVSRGAPAELASDQAPEQLSLPGLLWLGLSFGLPGLVLLLRARAGAPWYRTRRYHAAE